MIKKITLILILLNLISYQHYSQTAPFKKGVNLTNWFQTNGPRQIHFTKYDRVDFENIKSLGADVVRLPINLHSMAINEVDYRLDPLFLSFLDKVMNWAEELEINLILDNHTFDPAQSISENIGDVLIPIWENLAGHCKNRSKYIYYEILNEPYGIDDVIWNNIQIEVVNAIRNIDSNHTIIVGPAGWNSYNNLKFMPEYSDTNLIYTFHFYDPFLFTHQGASWTVPSLVSLKNIPFPYNTSKMPAFLSNFEGTWVQYAFDNYHFDGTISRVRDLIDIAVNFSNERNVPIFCGEFGVYMPNSNENDRVFWYHIVRSYLELNNIAWTSWDYHGGFGLFNQFGNDLFDHDLNINLLNALGFNIPPQSEYKLNPDSSGFNIYSDFIGKNIVDASYGSGYIDYYNELPKIGNYSLTWDSPSQYSAVAFNFKPIKDLSYLVDNNYVIGFWLKGNNPNSKFDIRFIDTKKSDDDRPWRMGYTIDKTKTTFNDQWQYIQIPLSSFNEFGSWDNNTLFDPIGLFNWKEVDRFEIVNEHGVLNNVTLHFDEIKIYDPVTTNVSNSIVSNKFQLFQNYPNPFNPSTTISFNIPKSSNTNMNSSETTLTVYDILGNVVEILIDKTLTPGYHKVTYNASNLSSGMYFYKLKYEGYSEIKKLLLVK